MSNRFAGEEGEIEFITKNAPEEKRLFTEDEREEAAEEHQALPDGSYPIKNREDLSNAVQAFGRAKDKARAKAHIKRRARALGCTDMLPEGW